LVETNAARRLGELIEAEVAEIERRWLERVQRDVAEAQGVELTQLRDGIPDYLSAMVRLLKDAELHLLNGRASSAWSDVAREHGITRVRIGFDISQLIHEFVVLRRVIGEVVDRELDLAPAKELVSEIVEAAIAVAVKAYVDARDIDARRKQAESIAFLTHELRNPLTTAVLTAAKLGNQARPEDVRVVETLQRNLGRLGELIDGVLLTQKLEAGQMVVAPADVELAPLLESALESARKVAETKRLAFHASYDPGLTARLDPILTRSAIANLVDNAVKYTDTGEVDVEVLERRDDLVVNVRDTCPGLSADELRTIFEPFKRGASARGGGTGLGLAIARLAVEAQGGSIRGESPGGGATGCRFSITLPKRCEGRARSGEAKSGDARSLEAK
jgi:signal transduction histidine kinase